MIKFNPDVILLGQRERKELAQKMKRRSVGSSEISNSLFVAVREANMAKILLNIFVDYETLGKTINILTVEGG